MNLNIADIQPVLNDLQTIYEHPSRTYHNLEHINDMLKKLSKSAQFSEHYHRIFLAVWFHDVVYDAKRADNELKSSEFWMRKMTAYLLDDPLQWGKRAILATINHYPNSDSDIQLLLDLDLASLGTSWEVFQENTKKIRQEYNHVSDDLFREGRKSFLEGMLERPRLYGTEYWYNLLEKQARKNIQKGIQCLME